MKKVLLVEDDPGISVQLAEALSARKEVTVVLRTDELVKRLRGPDRYDLLILDRMMHQFDTKELLPLIRELWPDTSILVISTINTPQERAELIELGADDYLGKPFLTMELLARARSLLRRLPSKNTESRDLGSARLDLANRRISAGDVFEDLPAKEFVILKTLSDRPGRVVSRAELLAVVWGENHSENNLVEATVTNLRRRLANLNCGLAIKNQRNAGYWLES